MPATRANSRPTINTNLQIQYIAWKTIKPNSYNPNREDEKAFQLLCQSVREDGWTQPLVIHKIDKTKDGFLFEIVDGEHRHRVAGPHDHRGKPCKMPPFPEVPAVVVTMSPEQMRIATLRHNRARGNEVVDLTANVFRELEALGALGWAADSLLMDKTDIDDILAQTSAAQHFAGKEFGEAWTPEKGYAEDSFKNREKHGDQIIDQGESVYDRERRMAQALTDEEREMIKNESKTYRVVLVYADNDAEMAKAVLGESPAQVVLDLIKPLYQKLASTGGGAEKSTTKSAAKKNGHTVTLSKKGSKKK